VEHGQHVLGGGLHAQADPGEVGFAQRGQGGGGDRLGVGLGGHLDVGGDREQVPDGGQDGGQVGGRQQGGRAAPDEAGRHLRRLGAQHGRGPAQLGDQRAGVLGPVGPGTQLVGGVGVEVAVAAAGGAERHVHVEPERRGRQGGAGGVGQPVGVWGGVHLH